MIRIKGEVEISKEIDFNVSLDFVENFLTILGGIFTGFCAIYESKGTQFIKFRFPDLTRDSVDVIQIGKNINNYSISKEHGLYVEGYRYFLVTAVVRTNSISIMAENESKKKGSQLFNCIGTTTTTIINDNVSYRQFASICDCYSRSIE
jgi:hypothetical protein